MNDYYQIALNSFGWQEVTMWFRCGEFNHIEEGHAESETPKPQHESHVKAWGGAGWQKLHTYMTRDVCPKVFYP